MPVVSPTYLLREHDGVLIGAPRKTFHVYCSPSNGDAVGLMRQVASAHRTTVEVDRSERSTSSISSSMSRTRLWLGRKRRYVVRLLRSELSVGRRPRLLMTQDPDELANCDHFLLHLTARTWNGGEASSALATEVHRAMATEVHLLLAHEMVGVDDVARDGCEFSTFFQTTPFEYVGSEAEPARAPRPALPRAFFHPALSLALRVLRSRLFVRHPPHLQSAASRHLQYDCGTTQPAKPSLQYVAVVIPPPRHSLAGAPQWWPVAQSEHAHDGT